MHASFLSSHKCALIINFLTLISVSTFGELIELYEDTSDDASILHTKLLERYPVLVGRHCRLLETVKRIVVPTRPSLRGDAKLHGSPLPTYRKRIWKPCVRNVTAAVSGMLFFFDYSIFLASPLSFHRNLQPVSAVPTRATCLWTEQRVIYVLISSF